MNKVFLIGRLTKEPEHKIFENGNRVCTFSIAVERRNADKTVDFFDITTWNGLADNCIRFLTKGKQIAVVGNLQTSTYEKNGVTVKSVKVVGENVEFLAGKQHETAKQDIPEISTEEIPY